MRLARPGLISGKDIQMDNFLKAVPGILALIVVIGVFVLQGLAIAISPEMWAAFSVVLGFFFGSAYPAGAAKIASK